MNSKKATRNPTDGNVPIRQCTDFQVHVSQRVPPSSVILDLFEQRMRRMFDEATDPVKKLSLGALIDDYVSGHVAIAWARTEPVYLKVTKEG